SAIEPERLARPVRDVDERRPTGNCRKLTRLLCGMMTKVRGHIHISRTNERMLKQTVAGPSQQRYTLDQAIRIASHAYATHRTWKLCRNTFSKFAQRERSLEHADSPNA